MKKIYYLLAFVAVLFASCDPLSKTYKHLDALPQGAGALLSVTSTTTYRSISDANASIPALLTSKYPTATNSTPAAVKFSLSSSYSNIQSPDTLTTKVTSTLATSDYSFPASTLPGNIPVSGNSTAYLSADAAINYLNYKYPSPVLYQMVVLVYTFYDTSTFPNTTDTFIYFPGGWAKVYTLSNAQYASVNRGATNAFNATDNAALAGYFNAFLKADPLVMGAAKSGTVTYVSYRIGTFTKIMILTYDGFSWSQTLTLPFLRLNGVWVSDPTVYITFPVIKNSTYAYLSNYPNIGSADARANVISFGDFSISGSSSTVWNDADLTAALAAGLVDKIAKPVTGVPYTVTYYVYVSPSVVPRTKTFIYDGANFIYQGH